MQRVTFYQIDKPGASKRAEAWRKPVEDAVGALRRLAEIPWSDEFAHRDAIDIARMVTDRLVTFRADELGLDVAAWRKGERDGEDLPGRAEMLASLCGALADVLALHTDYSMWESYLRLDAVEKIANTAFAKTLFENCANAYCLSHQYELARHWVVPYAWSIARNIAKAVESGNRNALFSDQDECTRIRLAAKSRPLESLSPTMPRTEESFRKIITERLTISDQSR